MDSKLVSSEVGTSTQRIHGANNDDTTSHAEWGDLEDGIKEIILSKLPLADLFRLRLVLKPWNSLVFSPTFLADSRRVPQRQPWFLMLRRDASPTNVIYDTDYNRWRHIIMPNPTHDCTGTHLIPTAASRGLICLRSNSDPTGLVVCNPVTGAIRLLPPFRTLGPMLCIAMVVSDAIAYKVMVVSGVPAAYSLSVWSSATESHHWLQFPLVQLPDHTGEGEACMDFPYPLRRMIHLWEMRMGYNNNNNNNNNNNYILTHTMQWSEAKAMYGVGVEEFVHFIDAHGRLIRCDVRRGTIRACPELLSRWLDYSVDIVECGGGRCLVVIFVEIMGTARLEVWEFVEAWREVAAMPEAMANEYGKRGVDINCAGYGDCIMICLTSEEHEFYRVVMFDMVRGSWMELPRCWEMMGNNRSVQERFVSVYGFEPRLEATV